MTVAITIVLGWIAFDIVFAVVWGLARGRMKKLDRRLAATRAVARQDRPADARGDAEPFVASDRVA